MPWAVLGDDGRVSAFYDIDGVEVTSLRGLHVNATAASVAARHRSILNYAVPARYDGRPLINFHYVVNCRLSHHFNGSTPSYDAREISENFALFERIVRVAAEQRVLDLLFDRWVETRVGRAFFTGISDIAYRGKTLDLVAAGGRALFMGTIDELLAATAESLDALCGCIEHGTAMGRFGYPWLKLPFAYLFGATTEFSSHPTGVSIHAGGSASPYDMTRPAFRREFGRVHAFLATAEFLPASFRFESLPTACCQLFSTNRSSVLDEIVERWAMAVSRLRDRSAVLARLARRGEPFCADLLAANSRLDPKFVVWLEGAVEALAMEGERHLPVCFSATDRLPDTFNKYGTAWETLRRITPRFPSRFYDLTWIEAEWLANDLALLGS